MVVVKVDDIAKARKGLIGLCWEPVLSNNLPN